jgi:hypothetical protein
MSVKSLCRFVFDPIWLIVSFAVSIDWAIKASRGVATFHFVPNVQKTCLRPHRQDRLKGLAGAE